MRDVSDDLFAPGEAVVGAEDHDRYLDDLAGWCAATWGFRDESPDGPWLLPYASRWAWFGHAALDGERALGWPERVPAIAAQGWQQFAERTPPGLAAAIDDLRREVSPLSDALRTTPSCLLHGDPKASNAGISADGRTVLIDWAYVGQGPVCHELGWHLALDRAKLPASKESIIAAFRQALERHGVATDGWWDRQLALALLGTMVQFGWEKALGDEDELRWWCAAAEEGLTWL